MAKQKLSCDGCGSEFLKENKEVNRRRKKNPECNFYCSVECYEANGDRQSNLGEHLGVPKPGNLKVGSKPGPFSPFRYFMRKARSRNHPTSIDLPYLENLWEEQGGICPLSGVEMKLYKTGREWERDKNNPWKPSLDRMDPHKGYVVGNVRFVTYIANMCKKCWSDEVVVDFCKRVADHN